MMIKWPRRKTQRNDHVQVQETNRKLEIKVLYIPSQKTYEYSLWLLHLVESLLELDDIDKHKIFHIP